MNSSRCSRVLLILALAVNAHAQGQRGFAQPESAAASTGRRLVVVIGIDDYKNWPKLTNATNDAVGFERELKGKLGFEDAAPPLLNQEATREALQHLVDDVLRRQLKPDDDLVLFFAGHGTTRVDPVGGKEIETGFLVPVEARGPGQEEEWSDYVQVDQFLESIARLPARHVLVILDACHSGFALGRAMDTTRGDVRFHQDVAGRVSRKVITSARRNQSASDAGPMPNHSLFTGALIDGIDSGAADLDGDGVVTSSELGLYLEQAVGGYSSSAQTPDFGSFFLDDRGELILPLGTPNSAESPRRMPTRRGVALLGFRDLSGRPEGAWISTALSEMLTTEVSAGDKLRAISGENVSRMKRDLALPDSGQLSADSLGRIYRFLGSDIVVSGSYLDVGKEVRVDVHVQNALTGDSIANISESGTEEAIFDLVSRLGKQLREKCGAGEITEAEAGTLKTARPSSTDAVRLYAEGISKLRNMDAKGARELLQQAVAADPGFAPAHSALAEAWSELGYDAKAKNEAKQAVASAKGLPRKDALLIDARYEALIGDQTKAADIYKSLWTFFPDEFEFGLSLVKALGAAGKGAEAATALAGLRQFPKPLRDDPRIDLAEAEVAESLADYKREVASATQAIEKSQRLGQRLAKAEAYNMECWAYRNLADLDKAEDAGRRAQDTFSSAADSRGVARSLTCLGTVASDKGNLESAREQYEQALSLATELGAQIDITGALINIGTVLQAENEIPKAIDSYHKAQALAMEIGDKSDLLLADNDLGTVFYAQGDFDAAADLFKHSLATARETGDQGGVVEATVNLGTIDYLRGALVDARVHVDAATAKAKALGMDAYEASSRATAGDILEAQGKLREAEQQYRESLSICTKASLKSCMANAWLSLAALALENNQTARAEELAHQALREFESERSTDLQAAAHDLIAQSLLAEGKIADAATEIDRALALSPQDQSIALSLAVSSGRLLTQQKKFVEAQAKLQTAADRASSLKLTGWQFQIRLRNAELQILAGKTEEGRGALQLLAKEASEKGYLLISRKATAALDSTKEATKTAKN